MITIVFTKTRLVSYCYPSKDYNYILLNVELAGEEFPMTSTLHVFLTTLINRYSAIVEDFQYPIPVNVVFPSHAYLDSRERRHLLNYLLQRQEIFELRDRKCLMQAAIEGWQLKERTLEREWLAFNGDDSLIIGVKENLHIPLKIKEDALLGMNLAQDKLSDWIKIANQKSGNAIIRQLGKLSKHQIEQIFNTYNLALNEIDSEALLRDEIKFSGTIVNEILKITTNGIFLHITNLYSRLHSVKRIFFLGSFLNIESLQLSLKQNGFKFDYQTTFINEEKATNLAADIFRISAQHSDRDEISKEQALNSTQADSTTANGSIKDHSDPTSESNHITQAKPKIKSDSKESGPKFLLSDEFVVKERFKDQEFLLFRGYKKLNRIVRLHRYVDYKDFKDLDRSIAFISTYKKERKLYPTISMVVNGRSGKYYYFPDIKAASLRDIIAKSRLGIGSKRPVKSDDLKVLIDIYRAIEKLPITFTNLTADNILIKQNKWWRSGGENEIFFLGVNSENTTKEDMTQKLDDLLQSLMNPETFDHITKLKRD
ncbi:MAG: hypothetical protein KJP00_09795 [Bacteroidia bacterium]|nr:hypothetical protein [Bacteroidia bacterium]